MPPIPITIGTIPHKVAFPEFEAAPDTTDDNDGGPIEETKSNIVPLPKSLQERFPKLPGVLKGIASTASKKNINRKIPYIEYCHNKK